MLEGSWNTNMNMDMTGMMEVKLYEQLIFNVILPLLDQCLSRMLMDVQSTYMYVYTHMYVYMYEHVFEVCTCTSALCLNPWEYFQ